jgi:hypothetical protein
MITNVAREQPRALSVSVMKRFMARWSSLALTVPACTRHVMTYGHCGGADDVAVSALAEEVDRARVPSGTSSRVWFITSDTPHSP